MKTAALLISLLLGSAALAETTTYDVGGMHCSSCAKSVKAEVCKIDGLEKCEVKNGKIVISTKAGVTVTQEQVQTALSKAGDGEDYQITGSHKSK